MAGKRRTLVCAVLINGLLAIAAGAHEFGPSGQRALAWQTPQIRQVIVSAAAPSGEVAVGGKSCLRGSLFYFNVNDEFAFDIDEDVDLVLSIAGARASGLLVEFEQNGTSNATETLSLGQARGRDADAQQRRVTLKRARFAGNSELGSDFQIRALPPDPAPSSPSGGAAPHPQVTICGLELRRSYRTPQPKAFGYVSLTLRDAVGGVTPARIGLYDHTGRMPLPNDEAVAVRQLMEVSRVVKLNRFPSSPIPRPDPWPVATKSAFYVNGRYNARLPAGEYQLVASKGPEYRVLKRKFTVSSNETAHLDLRLDRWTDMAAKGWYSGEDHIHYRRDSSADDAALMLMTQAEGLNVANVVQMGNMATTHFDNYDWNIVVDPRKRYVIVPGQEDPRTEHRGHTLQLNIRKPIRHPDRYLLYHKLFEEVRREGGLSGYAHPWNGFDFGARKGLAVDMPTGLVDFVEVLQMGRAYTATWFDYLNLGFKLPPSAGTDYPYHPFQPGVFRNYVRVDGEFTPALWFEGLKRGRTFVTDGPMLEFTVNGQGMGAELQASRGDTLQIDVAAGISPDRGVLEKIELIEQGEVIEAETEFTSSSEGRMRVAVSARQGAWFVVRVTAKTMTGHPSTALSSPIYVSVNGERTWKRDALPEIVARVKRDLDDLLIYDPGKRETEDWESRVLFAKGWAAQQPMLAERVKLARAFYDALLSEAAAEQR